MPPTSTMVTGHWARSVTRVVAWNGEYLATVPSDVAAASAAPGPTAWTQVLSAAKLSPRLPRRARNSASREAFWMSSKPSTRQPACASPPTEGSAVHAGRAALDSGPAASPAEMVAHPSVGHVVSRRLLTDTEAAEPSRSRPQSVGVSLAETSSQDRPPRPTTTRESPGLGSVVGGTWTSVRWTYAKDTAATNITRTTTSVLTGWRRITGDRVRPSSVRVGRGHGLERPTARDTPRLLLPIVDDATLATVDIAAASHRVPCQTTRTVEKDES